MLKVMLYLVTVSFNVEIVFEDDLACSKRPRGEMPDV